MQIFDNFKIEKYDENFYQFFCEENDAIEVVSYNEFIQKIYDYFNENGKSYLDRIDPNLFIKIFQIIRAN